MSKKRLTRSRGDKILGGVCGGIAEYFNIDSTLVRIIYALLTVGTQFSGIIIYLICLLIIPKEY